MRPKTVFMHVAPYDERRELHVALMENNYGIEILVDGYGCMAGEPGYTGILHLEKDLETGELMLYIWDDITVDDCNKINLEGASEMLRKEDEDADADLRYA